MGEGRTDCDTWCLLHGGICMKYKRERGERTKDNDKGKQERRERDNRARARHDTTTEYVKQREGGRTNRTKEEEEQRDERGEDGNKHTQFVTGEQHGGERD